MSKIRKSAKLLFTGNLISKAVGFVGSIFLARLLFPEDYAYLLMATILTAFANMLGDMGFENFYLQEKMENKVYERNVLNITFKLRVLVNVCLFIFQFIFSYFIAIYYEKEIVGELLRILAFDYLIIAATQVNLYILRKNMDYKPEVIANMSRDIIGTVVKITAAYFGFGALSFAFGTIVGSMIRMLVLLKYQRFIPDFFAWDKIIYKRVFYFGKHSLFSGISMYLTQYVDKILLTNYFSSIQTGFYFFANAQAQLPSSYLISPQGSLIMSFTAKYKNSPRYLMEKLSMISYFIATLMLPIFMMLFVLAEPMFHIVFGEKWNGSIELFQLFLLFFFVDGLMFPFAGLLTARGFPQVLSKLNFIKLVVIIIGLYSSLQYTSNVFTYASVFVIISIFFSILKAVVGIYLMKENFLLVVYNLRNLGILSILYIISYLFWKGMDNQVYIAQGCSIIFLTILFYVFFERKNILKMSIVILGEEHKISKYLALRTGLES